MKIHNAKEWEHAIHLGGVQEIVNALLNNLHMLTITTTATLTNLLMFGVLENAYRMMNAEERDGVMVKIVKENLDALGQLIDVLLMNLTIIEDQEDVWTTTIVKVIELAQSHILYVKDKATVRIQIEEFISCI